jgi:hypothetical protein
MGKGKVGMIVVGGRELGQSKRDRNAKIREGKQPT